jgi:hypothetical protein
MRARHQRSSVKLLNCIGVSLVRLAGAGPTTNGDSKATGSDRLDAVRHPYGRSVRRFLDLYLPRRSFELGCDLAAGHRVAGIVLVILQPISRIVRFVRH